MDEHLFHPGFSRMFSPNALTLGLMFPIARFEGLIPDMGDQIEMAKLAESLDFAALWIRDVPLLVPDFGDVGQIYDPWVWLGAIASHTKKIALSTSAIVLPIRHPLHVAKAATSVDVLSGGRFVLGVASGDRPHEFPAFGVEHARRGEVYRDHFAYMTKAMHEDFPVINAAVGAMQGADLIPKPSVGRLPTLVVGTARQSVEWIVQNSQGWVTYPREVEVQRERIKMWQNAVEKHAHGVFKPFSQSLFIDLTEDPDTLPTPIFLGYRLGRHRLVELLSQFQSMGVNHVILNMRLSTRPVDEVLHELASTVLPRFPSVRGRENYSL